MEFYGGGGLRTRHYKSSARETERDRRKCVYNLEDVRWKDESRVRWIQRGQSFKIWDVSPKFKNIASHQISLRRVFDPNRVWIEHSNNGVADEIDQLGSEYLVDCEGRSSQRAIGNVCHADGTNRTSIKLVD